MAFKTFDNYIADKNGSFFLLPNDKDFADVIFLYRNIKDVLVADVHYIKSPDYSGYVHCCGRGCPACSKGLRIQTKIFIPLYNYKTNRIEFWDRSNHFERQLMNDVLNRYPNPSEWVFRVTRNGEAGDVNTTYSIVAQGKNTRYPYDKILLDNGLTLPEGYSAVCLDRTPGEVSAMLNTDSSVPTSEYNYIPTPRASSNNYQPASTSIPEPVNVPIPEYGNEDELSNVPGMNVPEVPFEENVTAVSQPTVDYDPSSVPSVEPPMESTSSNSDIDDDLGDVHF